MKRYLSGLIGLAIIGASSLMGQSLAFGGECCGTEAACCGNGGCPSCCENGGCHGRCECCPQCGCKLEPVCQITCTTKKTPEHQYCCGCKEICVPGVARICDKCDSCNNGCQDECDCRCRIHEVHKLKVFTVTKETPVRQCTVQWVCPNCSRASGQPVADPVVTPPSPAPVTPAPSMNRLPPPPKTTSAPTTPDDIRMAGF
jgi:hypothetical protein